MKSALLIMVFGATLSVAATAVPRLSALPVNAAQDNDHDRDDAVRTRPIYRDYYGNRYYRIGNSEGYSDYRRHHQRVTHRHHYRTDDDRRAHDYGYHRGWLGRRWNDHDADDRR